MISLNSSIHIHLEEKLSEVIIHPHTMIWKGDQLSPAPTLGNAPVKSSNTTNLREKNKLPLPLLCAGQKEKQIVADKKITGCSRDREWELR